MEEVFQGPKVDLFIELNSKLDDISASLQRHQADKTQPSLNAAAITLLQQQQDFIETLASLPVTNESKERIKTLQNQMVDISTASIQHARNQGEITLAKQMKELLALLKRVTDSMFVTDKKQSICLNHGGSEDSLWRRLAESPHDRTTSDASSDTGDVTSSESQPKDDVRSIVSRQVSEHRVSSNEEGKKGRKRNRLRKLRLRVPLVFDSLTPTPARADSPSTEVNSESTDVEPNQCCSCTPKYGSDELSSEQNDQQATTETTDYSSLASELSQDTDNCLEQEVFQDGIGCVRVVPAPQAKRDIIGLPEIADSGMVPDMTSSSSVCNSIFGNEITPRQEGSNVSGYISPVPMEESIPSNVFDGVDIHLSPSDSSLHSFASFYSDYTHHEEESFRTRPRSVNKNFDKQEQNDFSSAAISFAPEQSFNFDENRGNAIQGVSTSSLAGETGVLQSEPKERSRGWQKSCDALKSMTWFSLVTVLALMFCLYLKASGAQAVFDYYSWWEVLYKHIDITKIGNSLF